jgi:3-hydroxybutyryl-CoA dehydrogenase
MRMDDHAESRPPIPEIRCIGVIGAGQMGTGIAEVAALADVEVRLLDVSQERLDQALERIDGHLHRRIDKGVRRRSRASGPAPTTTASATASS